MTDKISGVYKIENIINGKLYFGSSVNIYKRWEDHKTALRHNKHYNYLLQNAWNKYGEVNFKFELVEICERKRNILFALEQFYMDKHKTYDDKYGYNINDNAKCYTQKPATYEDVKSGKYKISQKQFDNILYYLINTNISIPKISELTGANQRSIYQIYFKQHYTGITKDLTFIQRKNSGENHAHNKLTQNEVEEIILLLLNTENRKEIADRYNVNLNTINDIYNHRTWKELTDNIEFPKYEKKLEHFKKPIEQYDLDGNYISTYESAREAEKITGIGFKMISRVCKGKRPHTHGYIFKFIA